MKWRLLPNTLQQTKFNEALYVLKSFGTEHRRNRFAEIKVFGTINRRKKVAEIL